MTHFGRWHGIVLMAKKKREDILKADLTETEQKKKTHQFVTGVK